MGSEWIAFAVSFLVGVPLTRLFRDVAIRWGLYDQGANEGRKLHTRPIPRVGGVALAASMTIAIVAGTLLDGAGGAILDDPLLLALIGGGGIIFAMGLFDDLVGARAWMKFLLQILAGLVVCAAGIRIGAVYVPWFGPVEFGWASIPVTVFWIVLVTNAINLIDGMDGLAGGVVALASSTLLVMSIFDGDPVASLLLASMLGAVLAFLVFNFNPASIFLGDAGSLLLGFVLAVVSVQSQQKAYTVFSVTGSMLILALPIFDLSMAVVRRALTGKPLFSADQHHVHHLLLRKGLSQRQSVLLLVGGAAMLEMLALVLIYSNDAVSALIMALLVPALAGVVHFLGYTAIIRNGRRELVMRKLTEEAECREALINALRRDVDDLVEADILWNRLEEAAAGLGLERLELEVEPQMLGFARPRRQIWQRSVSAEERGIHLANLERQQFELKVARRKLGTLRLSWYREWALFGPHDRALMQLLADVTTEALVLSMLEDAHMQNVLRFPGRPQQQPTGA